MTVLNYKLNMFNMMLYSNDPLNNSICQQQPLHRLMHSKGCSLILSASLLGVGITITVMSLRSFSSTNKIFLVGPILMTVGILGMSRFLMQYLKKANIQRRRRNQVRSSNSWQNPHIHQRHAEVVEPRRDTMQTLHIPTLCHGIVQREDSESAIYLGPTDSDEGTYSDDPPPYDSVAVNTGSIITSRVQLENSISSSLPSLPPYDEGLINPALDLSTETFPAPPPYEMVAVQPPSYSTDIDVIERPVRVLRHCIHSTKRKTLDPTQRTVHEVAQRLVESMQAQQTQRCHSVPTYQVIQERNHSQEAMLTDRPQRPPSLIEEQQVREDPELTEDADTHNRELEDRTECGEQDMVQSVTSSVMEESDTSNAFPRSIFRLSEQRSNFVLSDDVDTCCGNNAIANSDITQGSQYGHAVSGSDELVHSEDCLQHDTADISPVLPERENYDNGRPSREMLTATGLSSGSEYLFDPSRIRQSIQSDTDIMKTETESQSAQQENYDENHDHAFDNTCTTSCNMIIKDQTIPLENQYEQIFD